MFQPNGRREDRAGAKSKKHLDSKSVQELRAELDEIFETEVRTGRQADPELVAEYLAALEKKETGEHTQAQTHDDFEASWTQFTQNHPDLFPSEETKPKSRIGRMGRLIEVAVLAAAILVITAAAFRWPDYIVQWGRELMQVTPAESGVMELAEPNTDGYTTLAQAVQGVGMTDAGVPTWIPARYSIQDIIAQELSTYKRATAVYRAGDAELAVRITYYSDMSDMPNFWFEKNDDTKQNEMTVNGITYRYTENFGVLRATWSDGNYLYSISGEVSKEEMEQMVKSI